MTNILTLMSSSKKKIARVFFQQEQNGSLLKCTSVQKTWQTCWNFSSYLRRKEWPKAIPHR